MLDIYVINLKERFDRLEQVKKNFLSYNIILVEAIKQTEGYKGCFLSHKKCIELAKEKKLKKIIVIEDDCFPLKNFTNRLKNIVRFLDSYDNWDLMIGGGFNMNSFNILGKLDTPLENLYKINSGYCMHFVIYNNTSYDYFLNHEICKPIDHTWQNNLQCIVPIPFIATQLDNFSNISNKMERTFSKYVKRNNRKLLEYIQKNTVVTIS